MKLVIKRGLPSPGKEWWIFRSKSNFISPEFSLEKYVFFTSAKSERRTQGGNVRREVVSRIYVCTLIDP
jgi:hypothetical protein